MEKHIYFRQDDQSVVIAEGFTDVQEAREAVDRFLRDKAQQDGIRVRLMRMQDSGTEQEEGKFYFNLTTF
jgi:glutathionylspermidine synthase